MAPSCLFLGHLSIFFPTSQVPGLPAAQGHSRGAPAVQCSFKEHIQKSKLTTTLAMLIPGTCSSENPKGQTAVSYRLHSAAFPGQCLVSPTHGEYFVPSTVLSFFQHFTLAQKPFPKTLFSFFNMPTGYLGNELLPRQEMTIEVVSVVGRCVHILTGDSLT